MSIFISLFIAVSSYAIVGGTNFPSLIPDQLCQIVPIKRGLPDPTLTCSSHISGQSTLVTAGHCGHYPDDVTHITIDCASGEQVTLPLDQENNYFVFRSSNGPLNPRLKVQDLKELQLDQALLKVNYKFKTPPLSISFEKIQEFKNCFFSATGTDEWGRWGMAQAKKITQQQIESFKSQIQSDLLFLEGQPHVSGHDSGGALICDQSIQAIIVAQKNTSSILTSLKTNSAQEWLNSQLEQKIAQALPSCNQERTSSSLIDALTHVMGFEEVRAYLLSQSQQGFYFCADGMTLSKNTHQYFKNFILIKFFDSENQLVKTLPLLLQNASIQAHHSTSKRPWLVLDSQKTLSVLEQASELDLKTLTWSASKVQLSINKVSHLLKINAENSLEISSLFLGSNSENDYFLVSWLKPVTANLNNIFTNQVTPKFSVVIKNKHTNEITVGRHQSAFKKILVTLEEQIESISPKKEISLDQKIQKIQDLVK